MSHFSFVYVMFIIPYIDGKKKMEEKKTEEKKMEEKKLEEKRLEEKKMEEKKMGEKKMEEKKNVENEVQIDETENNLQDFKMGNKENELID